jgi:diguanylate cyclase (GGDEF)-like protein
VNTAEAAQATLVGSRARWVGYLYAVAALLSLATLLVPHGPGYDIGGVVAVTVVAAVVAVVFLVAPPQHDLPVHAAALLAAFLTTATIHFTDGLPNAASLFYLWIMLFASYFFSVPIAAEYALLIAALYVVSALWTDADYPLVAHTIATIGAFLGSGAIVAGLKRRIDSLVAALVETSRTDELTRLPNRRAFQEDMARVLARAARSRESLTLAVLDLDHFKSVNDRRGHPAGDEVLRRFSDVLRATIREGDVPARVGGEEFSVLLPGASADGAYQLAERVRGAVREEFAGDDPAVTVSIGLATRTPDNDLSAADLMQRSDRALYMAKQEGRDRVVADGAQVSAER